MSTIVDNFNSKVSATKATTSRPRSASVAVPATACASPEPGSTSKSSVHASVSVSLSESLASISAWASQIVPGSPPSVPSPHRSSFYCISPKTPRRNSLSATFLNFWESPSPQPQTPAPKPVSPADLLAHGYTSVFVHLPSLRRGSDYAGSPPESPSPAHKTANAPLPLPRPQPRPRTKSLVAENKEEKSAPITRLRSFSFKAKKPRPSHAMPVFSMPPVPALPPSYKCSIRPSSPRSKSMQSKKPKSTPQSRYGAVLGPGGGTGALPLAQEVALAQMLDGGSLDANVKRVTERHARATGAHSKSSVRDEVYKGGRKDKTPIEKRDAFDREGKVGGGVTGIYRDQNGRLWWDEDESVELAGLLPSSDAQTQVHYAQMPLGNSRVHNQEKEKRRGLLPRLMTSAKPPPTTSLPAPPSWVPLHSPSVAKPGRKGSASDASSPDTDGEDLDLDPAYAVCPRDPSTIFAAGYSMAAEKERHLRRAPRGIEAFGVSPLEMNSASAANHGARERRERKRPAPLTLPLPLPIPHGPATSSTSMAKTISRPSTARAPPPFPSLNVLSGPTREESEGRQEFFASAFAPAPRPASTQPSPATPASPPQQNSQVKVKAARRGSLSLGLPSFGLGAGGRAARRASVASASPTSPNSGVPVHAYPSPCANGSTLSKTSPRQGTAQGVERSLKKKASRSRLAGLFKRG